MDVEEHITLISMSGMKWQNHKIVTAGVIYSLTGGMVAALAAMAGSVLPDVLEFRGLIRHRTITHSLWGWLAICLGVWFSFNRSGSSSITLYLIFFLAAGAVMHICEDALSIGGIPLKTPFGQSIGLKIYKTGTISEEVTVVGLIVIFATIAWVRGFFAAGYFQQQFAEVWDVIGGLFHVWS